MRREAPTKESLIAGLQSLGIAPRFTPATLPLRGLQRAHEGLRHAPGGLSGGRVDRSVQREASSPIASIGRGRRKPGPVVEILHCFNLAARSLSRTPMGFGAAVLIPSRARLPGVAPIISSHFCRSRPARLPRRMEIGKA